MFAYKRTLVFILTLAVIAVSFSISRLTATVFDACYWYTICSVMLAELQLGLIGMELLKTDERAMPVFAGNLVVACCYFVFAIAMIFIKIPATGSLVVHSIALVLTVTLHIFLGLAHHSTKNNTESQDIALRARKNFLSALEGFKMNRKEWLMENHELAKKISSLLDDARFAPDSIDGLAEIDSMVLQKIDALSNAADPDAANHCADDLKSAFAYRRMEIQNNR